ncbi:Endogenous retrovirus group K member 11 Pol protein [Lonchura striata]|uniref:Endogenous retrovirus group K member 11 Pol protein n=1 Tax=Lonchura striata TaxID=40157 RepID=A0A218UNE9_9PASE|nr:Endogenous retrovirus group K member 11 Pol protein [Lonchura striata domestica]
MAFPATCAPSSHDPYPPSSQNPFRQTNPFRSQDLSAHLPPPPPEPLEPFVTFVDRLHHVMEAQVPDEKLREGMLATVARQNANDACRQAILSLPLDPEPTLQSMLQTAAAGEECLQPRRKTKKLNVQRSPSLCENINMVGLIPAEEGRDNYLQCPPEDKDTSLDWTMADEPTYMREDVDFIPTAWLGRDPSQPKPILNTISDFSPYRLALTEAHYLKDSDWHTITVDTEDPGTWRNIHSKYIVLGDTKVTPLDITIAPFLTSKNTEQLILWLHCSHPPVFLPKGQVIAQAIPVPGPPAHPEDLWKKSAKKDYQVCQAQVIGKERPKLSCYMWKDGEHKHLSSLLDTGADVTVIPAQDWPSRWELQNVAGKIQDTPVWVEQWPLNKQKLKALRELVKELAKGNIQETTSPWNSPVFVLKKPGKDEWRLLHDLRAINNVIEDMGPLQPGMPSPTMLPENWELAVIDIKNCFFQIPLHPDDAPRFAFSVPSINREAPMERYHWKCLPQGMKNSPTICQWYVSSLLSPVCAATEGVIIQHYMDYILICAPNGDLLTHALELTTSALIAVGFELREDKIQRMPPWKYLGLEINKRTIVLQKLAIKNSIRTLSDVQQLCGSLNWVRPWLGINNKDLAPLFNLLKGGEEHSSPRELTPEAKAALQKVQEAMSARQAHRYDPGLPFRFIILGRLPHLHGVIFQWADTLGKGKDHDKRDPLSIIEWVFLSHSRSRRMTRPQELVAELIRKARTRIRELAGCDFDCIHIPLKLESGQFTKAMLEHLLPAHKIFNSEIQFTLSTKQIQSKKPLKALTVFTDTSGGSHKSVMTWKDPQTQRWEADVVEVEGSPQVAELAAVIRAFEQFSEPFNLVTDSAYVAGVVSRAQDAILQGVSNDALNKLLSKLIRLVSHREQPFYVMHIRSHTDLPGFLAEGNRHADSLAAAPAQLAPLPDKFQQAKISHQLYHQNAPGLVRQFHLTWDQAKAIVATCPSCKSLPLPSVSAGANPRGLRSCEVWQMDVTHIPSFGRMKYVHVSVDTFSGAVFASAHTGEKAKDVEKHLIQAFSMLGVPKLIKTDNAPGYTSKEFAGFLQQWGIEHKTGIAYSPSGQAVVERTHQSIKRMLKQQQSLSKNESPQVQLARALFTINFLNCSFECLNPPIVRHFNSYEQSKVREKPPVLIKDPETWRQEGPYDLVTWGRGYACVSTPSGLRWVPSKFVRPYVPKTQKREPDSPQVGHTALRRRRRSPSPNPPSSLSGSRESLSPFELDLPYLDY